VFVHEVSPADHVDFLDYVVFHGVAGDFVAQAIGSPEGADEEHAFEGLDDFPRLVFLLYF
jgi:hypothetical protein